MNEPEIVEASQFIGSLISQVAVNFRQSFNISGDWHGDDHLYKKAMQDVKPFIKFIQDQTKADMVQEAINIDIYELMRAHWQWCEDMNQHNKTPLEYLALIGSEVGEAVNECREEEPTEELGIELADIILRTIDFAQEMKIDLPVKIKEKMAINKVRGTRGRTK